MKEKKARTHQAGSAASRSSRAGPAPRSDRRSTLTTRTWRFLLKIARGPEPVEAAPERAGLTSTRLFSKELRILGLHGRPFTWEEYRDRLQDHLGIEIHVIFVGADSDPMLSMMLDQAGTSGLVLRDEETGDALVLVSAALDDLARTAVVWHELAHVAGGHPMPATKMLRYERRAAGSQADGDYWDPPRSVLGPTAPRDEALCERDARLRAGLALQSSLSGRDPYRADESFFLLGGS